jgi:hypothetical protein
MKGNLLQRFCLVRHRNVFAHLFTISGRGVQRSRYIMQLSITALQPFCGGGKFPFIMFLPYIVQLI